MARGRFLSKSISLSEQVDELIDAEGYEAGLVVTWMIAHLDIEGRMKGSPRSVKGTVFPLRDDISLDKIATTLRKAAQIGLIRWYQHEDERCIWFPEFGAHQQGLRKSREAPSKIPEYSRSTPGVCTDQVPPKVREGKVSKEKRSKDAPSAPRSAPASPSAFEIPTTEGEHTITEADVTEWTEAYPAVDIRQALRSMRQWCLSNPSKKKTPRGVRRFVTAWLDKEQNRGGSRDPQAGSEYKAAQHREQRQRASERASQRGEKAPIDTDRSELGDIEKALGGKISEIVGGEEGMET